MCLVDTPSIPKSSTPADKPLPIIRNPILDGLLGNIAATRAGTSAFRIDLINPLTIPSTGPTGGLPSGGGSGGGGSSTGGGSGSGSTGAGSGGLSPTGGGGVGGRLGGGIIRPQRV